MPPFIPPSCAILLIAWLLAAVGFYVYELAGILVAIVPLGIAGAMRIDHDKRLRDRMFKSKPWKTFALVYYLGLLIPAYFWARELTELNGVQFVAVIGFPFILAMIANDVATCMRKRAQIGNRPRFPIDDRVLECFVIRYKQKAPACRGFLFPYPLCVSKRGR